MSPVVSSLLLFILAGLSFMALGSLAAALALRFGSRSLSRLDPKARHRVLVGVAAAPILVSALLLFAVALPSFVSLLVPELDHCSTHDDGHAHLCFVHLPRVPLSLPALLAVVFATSYVFARWLLSAVSILQASRLLRALATTALPTAKDIAIVETSQAVCMAAGLLRPRVLVSRGLINRLDADGQAVVLEHERAHIRRRDVLVVSLARLCIPLHLPGVGRSLVREIEIAAEQACDEETGELIGDRTTVAETILAVERLAQSTPNGIMPAAAVGFGASAVGRRVESLLQEPKAPCSLRPLMVALGAFTVAVLLGSKDLHHTAESLISVIAH